MIVAGLGLLGIAAVFLSPFFLVGASLTFIASFSFQILIGSGVLAYLGLLGAGVFGKSWHNMSKFLKDVYEDVVEPENPIDNGNINQQNLNAPEINRGENSQNHDAVLQTSEHKTNPGGNTVIVTKKTF